MRGITADDCPLLKCELMDYMRTTNFYKYVKLDPSLGRYGRRLTDDAPEELKRRWPEYVELMKKVRQWRDEHIEYWLQ